MEPDIFAALSRMDLKVLVEPDKDYGAFVAYCIETGAVASGETEQEAESMIKQTLELDMLLAIRAKSLQGLLHTVAPADIRARWYENFAAFPEEIQVIKLNIPSESPVGPPPPKRSVQPEFTLVRSRQRTA
jgi:hypothetical protein